MKLNNKGWGLMEFLLIVFAICMVVFLAAGEIHGISDAIS